MSGDEKENMLNNVGIETVVIAVGILVTGKLRHSSQAPACRYVG